MRSRDIFLNALLRKPNPRPATGSATSVVTMDLMDKLGISFPDAHLDAEKMARLAAAGHTVLGFDNIMPLFSVCHESSALGVEVDWGAKDLMPSTKKPLFKVGEELVLSQNFLENRAAQVPIQALGMLKKEFGNDVAVVGKVFGPWTLGYHVFGVEEFLINTILNSDAIKKAIEKLKEIAVIFGFAQIEAGADALCVGDHATRDLCSPGMYRSFLQTIHQELKERLPCPLILHICGDTADRIEYIRQTGISCFHFDSKVPSAKARELAGESLSLMGGTSNFDIIRNGNQKQIAVDVKEKIVNRIDIIGPECAVPLDAPSRNLKLLADEVKKYHNY